MGRIGTIAGLALGVAALAALTAGCARVASDDEKHPLDRDDTLPLDGPVSAASVGARLVKLHDQQSEYGNNDGAVQVAAEGARRVDTGSETVTRTGARPHNDFLGFDEWWKPKATWDESHTNGWEFDGYDFWHQVDRASNRDGAVTPDEAAEYVEGRWGTTLGVEELQQLKADAPAMWDATFNQTDSRFHSREETIARLGTMESRSGSSVRYFSNEDFTHWAEDGSPALRIVDIAPQTSGGTVTVINPFLSQIDHSFGNDDGLLSKREILAYTERHPEPWYTRTQTLASDDRINTDIPAAVAQAAFGATPEAFLNRYVDEPEGGWRPLAYSAYTTAAM